jgi:oligosaccharide repeat unit polymerase
MLLIIYLVLIFLSLFFTKIKYNVFLRPNTIFTVLWCTCAILANYYNLGLIKPSLKIHIYVIISVITFNLIYFSFTRISRKLNLNVTNGIIYVINYRFITLMVIIAFLLVIPNLISGARIFIQSGWSFDAVRINYASLNSSGRFFYVFLTSNIPKSIIEASLVVAAIDLSNRKYKLLPWALIGIIISTISFGGRYQILNFIVYYVAAYIINKKYLKVKLKKSYIIIGIFALGAITVSRGTSGMSVLDMAILYFEGSFSYLQVILNNPDLYGFNERPLYGYLTFGFFFEPIVLTLKLFLGLNIDVPSYHFNVYAQQFVNIGDSIFKMYNNNSTMFYTFLRDFGEIGIIIGTSFLVLAICFSQRKYEKFGSLRGLVFLVYLYSVIVNSTMMYSLTSISSSLTIIFLILFSKQRKLKLK